MIKKVKNQKDAYLLADEFVQWLNAHRDINCSSKDIVVTGDTVENFKDACCEIDSAGEVEAFPPEYAGIQGGKIHELMKTQRRKGESRRDLYILDTGKYRLVYIAPGGQKQIIFNHRDWLICETVTNDGTFIFYRGEKWPHFLGQIYDEDESPVSGTTLSLTNGQVMANIVWYGQPVTATAELVEICKEAGQALDAYDGILAVDRRELLRREIEESGLSIAHVARLAGISHQTTYDYLAGKTEMTVPVYNRIMAALDSLP